MHLKRLDILGFKSFANKTSIKFSSGITAIVGPNGCGKTNILDALRWVLGEQKVSLLRGTKMEEVIFNGTRDVKPLGMAEVSLLIVNDRGILPTEYNEIQITRRLFRSGESEYLLNRVPCRRKDILELFFDTGMGAHSYSVIQPEMIDAVLSDKAEERRFLFEEAAGITKYKQRKEAALRKLEATENDFLRLKDIYAEVKTRVNSLYRQHKKAERYQMLTDEIKKWELYLSSTRIKNIENEKREIKAHYDRLIDEKTACETALDQNTAQLEIDRKELLDIEHQLNEVSTEAYKISEQAHLLEKEITLYKEKKNNAVNLIQKNEADIETLSNRRENLKKQAENNVGDLEIQRQLLEQITVRMREAEEAQAEADRNLLAARARREEENKRLLELEGQLSSGKAEGNSLREQEEELTAQKDDLEKKINDIYPRQKKIVTELETLKSNLDSLISRRKEGEARKAEINTRIENLVRQGEELTLESGNVSASIEACEARRNLWQDMMLHYEGYESGMVATMENRQSWPGIAGSVGEKFIPQKGLETALEVALGDMAKCLICRDRKTAEDIITFLKREKKGRIGILVPDTGTINPAVKRPVLDQEEFVGWLDTFVTTDNDLQYLKEAVLSHTAVYRSGANPDEILKHLPYGFSAVSTDGILYSNNLISGGSEDDFSLFRRKEKVQEQDEMLKELNQKLQTLKEDRNRSMAQLAAARAEFTQLLSAIEDMTEETEQIQKRIGELEFESRTVKSELTRLENEHQNIDIRLEKVRNRQYSLDLDFNQLSSKKDNLLDNMNQAGNRLEDLEKTAMDALDKVSKLHVSLIETRSRVEQAENQQSHLHELIKEIDATLLIRREEIDRARTDIIQADEKITANEANLKIIFEDQEKLTIRRKSLYDAQTALLDQVATREKNIKEHRRQKESLSDEAHQFEIRLNTIESEIKAKRDKFLEEYDVDIKTVEIENPDDRLTIEEAREQLQEKKERLKKFGAVNLLALEEYRENKEREEFLNEQLNDLTTAKNDLRTTINKINVTARKLFSETFEKVQKNFQSLFVELFTGGEADIHLSVPDDPLESNIEIVARPRGKKILSISQMSGGERALIAISLLFSLYLVKPSPFCILDEIDAPLDDANCHRFLKIIKNFSRDTQFIAITHNKITMEAANNLYGITMEQPGISKLVAVKFLEEAEDTGGTVVQYVEEAPEPEEIDNNHQDTQPVTESDSEIPETIRERMNPNIVIQDNEEE